MLKFRIQSTPNPKARKYIINEELKAEGKISYQNKEDCIHVPLAYFLLQDPSIKQIHFFENVLTITQNGTSDWSEVDQQVQAIVAENIATHDIFFEETPGIEKKEKKELSGDLKIIDQILEETIRPSLQNDGGDVIVVALENSILTIQYQGACNDCPSSLSMTLAAIQNVLAEQYDDNIQVVAL